MIRRIAQRFGVTYILAVRLVVFISEAYLAISQWLWFFQQWYFGLTFGIVILVWRATSVREAVRFRSLAFLAASALIWMLVFQLLKRSMTGAIFVDFKIDARMVYGAVALGTVLLPVAHAQLLGTSWTRMLITIPGILGVWGIWLLANHWAFDNLIGVEISIWQAAYLLFMFGSKPKFLRRT